MVEGSPTDQTPPVEPAPATPPAEGEPVAEPQAQTVEEVEAIWKNRIAGKDRAHVAETETLRSQLAAEKSARERAEAGLKARQEGELSDADQWKAKAEAAEQRAAAAEEQRIIDVRVAKYPNAAEHLEPSVMAAMDEAKLAALNARLTDETPSLGVDPNTPRRQTPAATAPTGERSVAQLEDDLKKFAPEWKAGLEQ